MDWKKKLKNSNFWMGAVAAVFIVLRSFGVKLSADVHDTVLNAILTLLVLCGFIGSPNSSIPPDSNEENTASKTEETKDKTVK